MNEENDLDAELEAIKAYTQATMKNVKAFEDGQRTAKEESMPSTPPRYDAVYDEAMATLNSNGVPRIVGPHRCGQCERHVYHFIDGTFTNYWPKDEQPVACSDGHITGFHQYDRVLTEEEIAEEYAKDSVPDEEKEVGKRLCWRGKWQQNDCNVEYKQGDWVKVRGEFYRCTCDHWSEDDVKPGSGQYWSGYWDCYGEEGPASQKEREAEEQSNTIKRLEFRNRGLVNEIGIVWKLVEVERRKFASRDDSMSQCNKAVEELREALNEKITACNRLYKEVERYKSMNEHLQTDNHQLSVVKEIDAYKDSARDLGRKLDKCNNRIDELEEEVDGSKYLLASYSHENKLYKDKAERLENAVNVYKDERQKLWDHLEDNDKTIQLLQSDNHALDESDTLYREKAAWWKGEAEKLESLYRRYRKTAHNLYGELNVIARAVKFARENIAIAHTAEEWQEHLPEGYTYIEESAPFTKEDWDKVVEMAKTALVISDEEPIDMDDVEGSIEAAVQHYIDELNDAEETAEKEG